MQQVRVLSCASMRFVLIFLFFKYCRSDINSVISSQLNLLKNEISKDAEENKILKEELNTLKGTNNELNSKITVLEEILKVECLIVNDTKLSLPIQPVARMYTFIN